MRWPSVAWVTAAWLATTQAPAGAQENPGVADTVNLTAEQVLGASARALGAGDEGAAKALLEALLGDPALQVRNEARFRLAKLASSHKDHSRAAAWLRAILDEEPGALAVRLEFARELAEMGDNAAARRELRQAQSGGLPPEVARVVNQFSAALRERKLLGGNFEIALAPDSNVNRATNSDTLGTVIGDFVLDDAAKAHSGLGLAVRGTGYARLPIGNSAKLLAQVSVDGSFYGHAGFNDVTGHIGVGPEFDLARSWLQAQASYQQRWFAGRTYSDTLSAAAVLETPLGPTAQLRLTGVLSRTKVVANPLQNSTGFQLSAALEKALSPKSGASLTLSTGREHAREPAYSTWYGQVALLGWVELGRTTLIASAGFAPLWADERLAIYPRVRRDHSWRLSSAATLRQFALHGFAPQLRLSWENSASTIELYRYSRLRAEMGVVRAF